MSITSTSMSEYQSILDKPHNTYNEGVSMGHFFVLYDDKGNAKNDPTMCKDYFQDYFWACYTNKSVNNQYGYTCKPEPLCDTYTFVIGYVNMKTYIGYNGCKFCKPCVIPGNWIISLRKFMRAFSKDFGYKCPIITKDISNRLIIVKFDKKWTEIPYMFSLFTYFLRLGCYVKYEDFLSTPYAENDNPLLNLNSDNQSKYNDIRKKVLKLREMQDKPQKEWKNYSTQNDVHNCSGIISLSL